MKKYLLLFASAFVVCPCPVHGTLLGLSLAGGTAGFDVLKKRKCVDKHCHKC